MKNKTLVIIIILLMALLSSIPFWLDAIATSENNSFLYTAVFFWLTLIAFVCSAVFLIIEVKKINDKVWLLLLVTIPIIGVFLSRTFDSATVRSENILLGIISEPIMWLLIATLIGHLVLFIYKRNNLQTN